MQGPETLYFLFDENNQSLYEKDGLILPSPTPVPIRYAPIGWKDIGIMNQRNSKYFALDRFFSIPLEFVEDGALILKDRFYRLGYTSKVTLVIAKQVLYFDDTHYGFYYTLLFKGEVDLTTFNDLDYKVTVNIMEGGIVKYVKANENAKYETPVDVPESIKIKWDGIKLRAERNWVMPEITYQGITAAAHLPTITFTGGELANQGFLGGTQALGDANSYIMLGLDTVTFPWSGQLKFTVNNFVLAVVVRLYRTLPDNSSVTLQNDTYNPPPANALITINYNFPAFTINKDERINVSVVCGGIPASQNDRQITYLETHFNATFMFQGRTTFVKALRPKYLYQKTVEQVTEGTAGIESKVLEDFDFFAITCGNAIRGLSNPKVITSLSDFFQSYNSILSLGMGEVNGKLRLERKSDWIDYAAPIQLGEGNKTKRAVAVEYLFNLLKIGYKEQEYNDVNGKNEFCNTHEYTAPAINQPKELNLVSIYRADCYGAEFLRISRDGQPTTDSSSDNDIWVIHIKSTPIIDPVEGEVYELDRSLNPYASGILEPDTVFNIFLSPKYNLFRNGPFIRSCFYKMDTKYLTYQTTEKNSSLSVAPPGGPVITENANVEIAALGTRLFVPILLEFETRVPLDLLELLAADPLKSFTTLKSGIPLTGIPVKVGIQPEDNEAQAYQLLASPDTDLEQLIEIFD